MFLSFFLRREELHVNDFLEVALLQDGQEGPRDVVHAADVDFEDIVEVRPGVVVSAKV